MKDQSEVATTKDNRLSPELNNAWNRIIQLDESNQALRKENARLKAELANFKVLVCNHLDRMKAAFR